MIIQKTIENENIPLLTSPCLFKSKVGGRMLCDYPLLAQEFVPIVSNYAGSPLQPVMTSTEPDAKDKNSSQEKQCMVGCPFYLLL